MGVEGGPVPVGAVLAEAGDGGEDNVGLDLLELLVGEAHFGNDAGAEVFEDYVGGLDELSEDLLALFGAHVEGDALLAAVVDGEVDAGAVDEGCVGPGLFAAGLLDLDDLGAHVGHDHAGPGPGLIAGEFQHFYSVKATGHGSSLLW